MSYNNFIRSDTSERMIHDLFTSEYQRQSGDEFYYFDELDLPGMMVLAGCFPSKTQAKKNGWTGPIQLGLNEYRIGKRIIWSYIPIPFACPDCDDGRLECTC